MTTIGRLATIWRHPVKSLGREALDAVTLGEGAALPMDRVWALAHGGSRFDPAAPAWCEPGQFLRVTHAHRLAQVDARWDGARVTVTHPDAAPLMVDPDDEADAQALADWAAALADGGRPGPYRVARAPQPMTDTDFPSISIASLASLRALGEVMALDLDPRRFRANLWLDGLAPWQEASLVGQEIAIGNARLKIVEPIGRCAATEANPASGRRDAPVVRALRAATERTDFGVYAVPVADGAIRVGDAVSA